MAELNTSKIYDLYASLLNYKKQIGDLKLARSYNWIPDEHLRRLQAYELLTAFYQNYSRDFRMAPEAGDEGNNDDIMESGDAAWLCNKIKAKLLGGNPKLSMPGPKTLRQIKAIEAEVKNGDSARAADLPGLKKTEALVIERLQALTDWYDDNDVAIEIDENETACSYLGDMVYLVEWLAGEQRPNIRTYDAGYYLPDENLDGASLEDGASAKVLERAYVAWEEEQYDADEARVWRDVYELRDINGTAQCFRHFAMYKFSGSVDTEISDFDDRDIVEGSSKGWQNLGIDFIPLVHVPNIKMQGQKFGASNLHWHVALVDAIINAYNDLKHNAEYLGGATVFASGKDARYKRDSSGDPLPVGIAPNTMYMLGEGGDMQLLDTANLQKALLDTIEKLDKKLIRNAEITEVGAGVYSSQQELSGKALKILIQPLLDKITPMRAIRRRRYTMLFWMVQRLLQVYGSPEEKALFAGDLYNCYLEFGNILPDDEAEQVDEYVKLEGLIGIEATLDKMIENGWTLDKAAILAAKQEAAEKAQASMMDAFGVRRAQDTGGSDTGAGNADQGAGGQEQ